MTEVRPSSLEPALVPEAVRVKAELLLRSMKLYAQLPLVREVQTEILDTLNPTDRKHFVQLARRAVRP